MATTINASTSAGLVSTADTSGVLQLQAANTTVLNGELGKALALQGATSTTGCGIAFPATQVTSTDANTLDDYEEGTWTPSLGGTTTYTTQLGQYVKIGRNVQIYGQLDITTLGTGSSSRISGFPFVPSSNSALTVEAFASAAQTINNIVIFVTVGINYMYGNSAPATSNAEIAFFTNGTKCYFAGSYLTAT